MLRKDDYTSSVNNWRFKQEEKGRPIADKIYRKTFGNDIEISREKGSLLDREHAIDVKIVFSNGMVLTGQEKFLSCEQSRYRSVTVEYMQNPKLGEQGDWFKLASQFYFVGYFDEKEENFNPWILLDWPTTVIRTNLGFIKWHDQTNKNDGARASFKYAYMDEIPNVCVIDKNRW